MPDPATPITPESIVAEITTELVTAIVAGVPWLARGPVKLFGPKVAAWAIGLIVLKTLPVAYPILLAIEPFAAQMLLPEVAKWFTAAKQLYATKIGTVHGVDLTSIVTPRPMQAVMKRS